MSRMRVLDLFSGIGGFSLGLERAGMRTMAFCEIEPYCRAVLRKHWPDVPIYDDVRTLTAERLAADGIAVDVICGGFPCQDISCAGAGAGIEGERSGLWREYSRLIGELRPRYAIVENVSALLGRGLDVVLGDLAALGFDAEWHCIPASAVGAPHRRDRVWIVAYPGYEAGSPQSRQQPCERPEIAHRRSAADVAHANGLRSAQQAGSERERGVGAFVGREDVADSDFLRCKIRIDVGVGQGEAHGASSRREAFHRDWWSSEPGVGRVAHGVPSRVDRLGALGNAVVPQVVEIIGKAILRAEEKP